MCADEERLNTFVLFSPSLSPSLTAYRRRRGQPQLFLGFWTPTPRPRVERVKVCAVQCWWSCGYKEKKIINEFKLVIVVPSSNKRNKTKIPKNKTKGTNSVMASFHLVFTGPCFLYIQFLSHSMYVIFFLSLFRFLMWWTLIGWMASFFWCSFWTLI